MSATDITPNEFGYLAGTHQPLELFRADKLKAWSYIRSEVVSGIIVPTIDLDSYVKLGFESDSVTFVADTKLVRKVKFSQVRITGYVAFPNDFKQSTLQYLSEQHWVVRTKDNNGKLRLVGVPGIGTGARISFVERNEANPASNNGYSVLIECQQENRPPFYE